MLHIVPRDASIASVRAEILTAADAYGVLAYDVESTGRPIGLAGASLRTVQFGTPTDAWYLLADAPVHKEIARQVFQLGTHFTAHGAQFDIKWLNHAGLANHDALWRKTTDTYLLSHILDTNREHHDLKTLAASWADGQSLAAQAELKAYFTANKWIYNSTIKTPLAKIGWANADVNLPLYQRYACSDVLDGAALCLAMLPYLTSDAERGIVEDEHRIARMMSGTTQLGWLVDTEHALALKAELEPAVLVMKLQLADLGLTNPNANRQVAALLMNQGAKLSKTESGEWCVDSDALASIGTPTADLILNYKESTKALETYVNNTLAYASGDGRIHASIKTLGARTARMSSGEPNLQNVPASGGYREMYIADENEVLISCDFSSVEPRILAAATGDPQLLADYAAGIDPYELLAEHCFPDEWANASKVERKAIRKPMKPTLLGRAYLGGLTTLATQTAQPPELVQKALDFIDQRWPTIHSWSMESLEQANQGLPEVTTLSGRRVPLRVSAPYTGGNSQIQSYARDVLVYSCFELEDQGLWPTVRAPVHDELIGSVPEHEAEDYRVAYAAAMHTTVNGVTINGEADILGRKWHK